ncbi:golgin subfamily A member 6-like protein 6 [Hyalella azteca]|uniref:Golgin subfamily A member 6-like protein 6 n=1 Tax=Hyalella azteca TaxID=294128 RepID=A0A8B7N1Y5_HYAAZ|nr:golgin subfamily A member 6-like protein 6 [Hyalella azteca]
MGRWFCPQLDGEPAAAAAGEVHFYKLECESLRRRLEELSYSGAGVAALRQDLDIARRREADLLAELDRARAALDNLKEHHDFLMHERDNRSLVEEELQLQWQSRVTELENRYRAQARRLTDDREAALAECEALRRRASVSSVASEDTGSKEQVTLVRREMERQRREFELKLQLKEHEADEERIRHGQDKRDKEQRIRDKDQKIREKDEKIREKDDMIRQLEDEKRRDAQIYDDRLRAAVQAHEKQVKELQDAQATLSSRLQGAEALHQARLQAQAADWRRQTGESEDSLRAQEASLRDQEASLRAKEASLRDQEASLHAQEASLRDQEASLRAQEASLRAQVASLEQEVDRLKEEVGKRL